MDAAFDAFIRILFDRVIPDFEALTNNLEN
jgi:hypothetical protein